MRKNLRIIERKNATSSALAEEGETKLGKDPDLRPMDIRTVGTEPLPAEQTGGSGPAQGSSTPRLQQNGRHVCTVGKSDSTGLQTHGKSYGI